MYVCMYVYIYTWDLSKMRINPRMGKQNEDIMKVQSFNQQKNAGMDTIVIC